MRTLSSSRSETQTHMHFLLLPNRMTRIQTDRPQSNHAETQDLSPVSQASLHSLRCACTRVLQRTHAHKCASWRRHRQAHGQAVTILDTADLLRRAKAAVPRGNCFHIIHYITQSFLSVFLSLSLSVTLSLAGVLSLIITSFSWHCPFHPTLTY